MRHHVTEEARHLSFARHYLKRRVPTLGPVKRQVLAVMTPVILGTMAQLMMQAPSDLIARYAIPPEVVREAYTDNPEHRAHTVVVAAQGPAPRPRARVGQRGDPSTVGRPGHLGRRPTLTEATEPEHARAGRRPSEIMVGVVDPHRLVGLLATPERLRVVAAIVLGRATMADISDATGLSDREIAEALSRLVAVGLVETVDGSFVVDEEAFTLAARSASQSDAADGDPLDERGRILRRTFDEGRLVEIPTKRSTRLVVLDEIVQRFEIGTRYTEREVNESIAQLHPDTAALRRYLVDEGLMSRGSGEYWRIGGTVELD